MGAIATALGAATVVLPALASSETPTITATGYPYLGEETHYWSPTTAGVSEGGAVLFSNPSATVPHGLRFTSGPAQPSCSGLPASAGEAGGAVAWEASCTFTSPGTYSFVCTVHPGSMKGTITVAAGGATTVLTTPAPPAGTTGAGAPGSSPYPPPAGGSGGSGGSGGGGAGGGGGAAPLIVGGAGAIKLSATRHGAVHGSLLLSSVAAGGTLEVDLLARHGSYGASAAASRLGHLLRHYIAAGPTSFTVPLSGRARRTLRARGRLPITVRIRLTAPGGKAQSVSRALTMRR